MLILLVIFTYANLSVFLVVTVLVPIPETLFLSVSTPVAIAVPTAAPKGSMSWKGLGIGGQTEGFINNLRVNIYNTRLQAIPLSLKT